MRVSIMGDKIVWFFKHFIALLAKQFVFVCFALMIVAFGGRCKPCRTAGAFAN